MKSSKSKPGILVFAAGLTASGKILIQIGDTPVKEITPELADLVAGDLRRFARAARQVSSGLSTVEDATNAVLQSSAAALPPATPVIPPYRRIMH